MMPQAVLQALLAQQWPEGADFTSRLPPPIGGIEMPMVEPGWPSPGAMNMPILQGRGHLAPPEPWSDIPDWLPALSSPYGGWGGGYMQARRRGLR